jgi:hypothetical protein
VAVVGSAFAFHAKQARQSGAWRPARLPELPMFGGRCRGHARWPTSNPGRASGGGTSKLKRLLIAQRGAPLQMPLLRGDAPLELHLNGVEDNRPEALELRCRKHNPRGAPTHKR